MTRWNCDQRCTFSIGGAGPWDDRFVNFSTIRDVHKDCAGFKQGKSRQNCSRHKIDMGFIRSVIQHNSETYHDLIASVSYLEGNPDE